jgi:hypothetical protein
MITDQQAENALDYLRTNASKAAKAKAERVYLEEYRKTVKSNEMQKHLEKPLAAQEREAYASEEYKAHLDAMREAIEKDEYNRWGMVAAQATLDAWRTENANRRGEMKLG